MSDERSALRPDVISRLQNMELRARLVVEGFITGLHQSPYHGFSVEFAEHRQYMPGDEIRYVDWKVFGRTDRYFIKQFEEETNLKAYLVVDASRSMAFASEGRPTKFEYARTIAAAMAYLMVQQRDAVGLALYDATLRAVLPPHSTRSYLREILRMLAVAEPARETHTSSALMRVAERLKRRGLVVVLSDLFDDPADVMSALKRFRHDNHEVIVMHVLDPLERSFAFGADALFKDMETGDSLPTQPYHVRKAYREAMDALVARYKRECREHLIDYVVLDTATPFDTALFSYLAKRRRLS